MAQNVIKKIVSILVLVSILFTGCVKPQIVRNYSGLAPYSIGKQIDPESIEIDFNQVHNEVLTFIMDEAKRSWSNFFFINNGQFDISGSNDPKSITITLECMEGTTTGDLDLFLSLVLQLIGYSCSEQNHKYSKPTYDSSINAYTDFGTVYSDYDLIVKATIEATSNKPASTLLDLEVKAGTKFPEEIDPRYWGE